MNFIRKRRRAFHRKRKVNLNSPLSRGGSLTRSHNAVVGKVFNKDLSVKLPETISAVGRDVLGKLQKRMNLA